MSFKEKSLVALVMFLVFTRNIGGIAIYIWAIVISWEKVSHWEGFHWVGYIFVVLTSPFLPLFWAGHFWFKETFWNTFTLSVVAVLFLELLCRLAGMVVEILQNRITQSNNHANEFPTPSPLASIRFQPPEIDPVALEETFGPQEPKKPDNPHQS